ncbi:hypothetical protein V4F39_25585 [Aquincola sp. MAHUQ-54]|uniref:DUF2964 family protein n=1 Tax=Aquincola agrisoli TaxID=3119538 RepID=A0AAW9QP39_9BURK
MRAQTLETLVWVLIYGGIIAASLGFFVADAVLGGLMQLGGAVAVAAGVLLIWVRSRRPN